MSTDVYIDICVLLGYNYIVKYRGIIYYSILCLEKTIHLTRILGRTG